jgi:hypothetical protein
MNQDTSEEEFLAELARRSPAKPCRTVKTNNGDIGVSPQEYRRLEEIVRREGKSFQDLIEAHR